MIRAVPKRLGYLVAGVACAALVVGTAMSAQTPAPRASRLEWLITGTVLLLSLAAGSVLAGRDDQTGGSSSDRGRRARDADQAPDPRPRREHGPELYRPEQARPQEQPHPEQFPPRYQQAHPEPRPPYRPDHSEQPPPYPTSEARPERELPPLGPERGSSPQRRGGRHRSEY